MGIVRKSRVRMIALRPVAAWLLWTCVAPAALLVRAQTAPPSSTIVLWEDGFPATDTAAPSRAQFSSLLDPHSFAGAKQLSEALGRAETQLLVLPSGSAFPEDAWPAIYRFLERGGNLIALGGQPFTRPAYRENNQWKLRASTTAYAQKLFINEYQATPGSANLQFQPNENFAFLNLPAFEWNHAWSLKIRLSDEDLYPRSGSGGTIDARLDALTWAATKDLHRLAAPIVQIDHFQNNFVGGRWILVPCDLPASFFSSAAGGKILSALLQQALQGATDFSVRPAWPLFLPGEPITLNVHWQPLHGALLPARVGVEACPVDGRCDARETQFPLAPSGPGLPSHTEIALSPAQLKGLQRVTARLYVGDKIRAVYNTGFWIRDLEYLRSGPRVTVNEDFFEFDGHPRLVMGTTYMASDVQRQFLMSPNPYIWDRDMREIRAASLNMLRTGWWTAWDQVMKQPGVVHEETFRALEAWLMTARKHDLPVQFTFFAFTPEMLGGHNPYLDPEALRRQKELILAVVDRFKDVPWLMWDLINEPSFDNPNRLWSLRPNGDPSELRAWNQWLAQKYPSRAALAEAWNTTAVPDDAPIPVPREDEFSPRAVYGTMRGANSLKIHDFSLFAQQQFLNWVVDLRAAIRATGSQQLVTVGQDEAGGREGLNPSFFSDAIDFTSMHPWWQLDAMLWDMLTAKQPGRALLEQEVGIGRQLRIDGTVRRSMDDEAALLERKLAMAMTTGAGAIQWLWNINSYMRDDNEVSIGAVRPDGTEKPEAELLRRFARFALEAGAPSSPPEQPEVAIVTSQAFQYSALGHLALEAQMKSLRALEYDCHVPSYVVAENQIARLGHPKLVILPSPQALSEETWQALLKYVSAGGNLLVTGSMERDEHWKVTHRLAALGLDAAPLPLNFHIVLERRDTGGDVGMSFHDYGAEAQEFLEALRFSDEKLRPGISARTFHGIPVRELTWNKGRIFSSSLPVELAEGELPTAALYSDLLLELKITSSAAYSSFIYQGVLIRATVFADRIVYLFVSESSQDADIRLRDERTRAQMNFTLPPLRSRIVVLHRPDGKVLAEYTP
jgi:hypothetical protein